MMGISWGNAYLWAEKSIPDDLHGEIFAAPHRAREYQGRVISGGLL